MPTLLPLIRQNMTQPGSGGSQLIAKTQGEVKWAADIAIPPLRCEIRELEASADKRTSFLAARNSEARLISRCEVGTDALRAMSQLKRQMNCRGQIWAWGGGRT